MAFRIFSFNAYQKGRYQGTASIQKTYLFAINVIILLILYFMNKVMGIFSKFERDELNKITSKAILEKLMNIRQNIDVDFIARRLIWELIQNAKDNVTLCNEPGEAVDVAITVTNDQFTFSHNKGFFTNEHIRGLIRKYSSSDKDRDTEVVGYGYKTTGRFGTGFMTTHLLSEKVNVESYYKNDEGTFNAFSFWLDRSGKTEAKIIEGINNSFNEAETSIMKSIPVKVSKNEFRTSFTYPLLEQKVKLITIALEEVKKGIAYTLINVPEINKITIDEELIGGTTYKVRRIETLSHEKNVFDIYNLVIDTESSDLFYLAAETEDIRIVIPISRSNNQYSAEELDAVVPRLHLDFPMIGTEDLNLPFIINSPLFEPTESRDGISLIEDEGNDISQLNCGIVQKAVELYNGLISFVSSNRSWDKLYNLCRINQPKKHSWIDRGWFGENVVQVIRKKLLQVPMVDVVSGERISIWNSNDEAQVYFPYAENASIREKIWELLEAMFPQSAPIKEHIDSWNDIIWEDCYKFSISKLSEEIQNQENLEGLAKCIGGNENDPIAFLNNYYNLLNVEGIHIKGIIADEFSVIPNQNRYFKKKTQLFVDKGIDEELKNACAIISGDPREYLVHKRAATGNAILYTRKEQKDVIAEINSIIKDGKHEKISILCDYLASLFSETNESVKRLSIFDFSKRVYPGDFQERRKIVFYDEAIWEESDKKSIFYIVSKVSDYKTVGKACEELKFGERKEFINWLDSLVTFLVKEGFENNINRDKHPILPNQNGVFCTKDNLFLDEGDIDEELKEIAKELGHDFRDELLDTSIWLELPENRSYSIIDVSEKISGFIKPILRDVDKRKEFKNTLKNFYLWMNENRTKADAHFSDLFEKRFLFLEDDDISLNIRKATELDQLMDEHGIKSIEDLRVQLSKLQELGNDSTNSGEEKINITKEILVTLGISSQAELERAFQDPAISAKYFHTSTPTTEMFIYAQSLIERAKRNIIKFLQAHPDYDCTDLEETAPTILAGIQKNGIPIQVVARPSDNGEVIIYYSSEKDTLDSENSELWVDNAISEPHILTLGRILKSTGINRIPIKMV